MQRYLLTFPLTLVRPHFGEPIVEQTRIPAVTENGPDDFVVDSCASIAETLDIPAGRPTNPVNVVAADAGVDADVIVLDDLAPLPDTSRSHVGDNHVTPLLLPDSRVVPPPSDDNCFVGTLATSLYQRIAFQADLVTLYQDLETALRIQKHRGDEFEQELRGWITIASPFVQFA